MLGKGLESLIPQKGNNSGNHDGHDNGQDLGIANHGSTVLSGSPLKDQSPLEEEKSVNSNPAPVDEPVQPVQKSIEDRELRIEGKSEILNPQSSILNPKKEEITGSIFHIEVDKVSPNPGQPRRNFNEVALQDLARSIREFGFLQPLVVSKIEKETPTG